MHNDAGAVGAGRLRVAFVVQRYGAEVNGGAEALCRLVAERIARHWSVEVLTTCALDYVTWGDHYPPGEAILNGVTVRRFSVPEPRDVEKFNRLSKALRSDPASSIADQEAWMRAQGPWSPGLLECVASSADLYDLYIFFGYLYAQTYFALPAVASKAVLVPCAHDEWTIHLGMWDAMFRMPSAYVFNTIEEKRFLERRFPDASFEGPVVGVATDRPRDVDPRRFRSEFELDDDFILYVGRIDPSKGCGELFDDFLEHVKRSGDPRSLVTLGRAVMPVPAHPQIHSLGFVSEQAKWDALAACDLLVMPSRYESLSMVLLEAWNVAKPVLVNGASEVLRGQVSRSNGGLAYEGREEFSAALTMLSSGGVPGVLARQGYEFVRAAYAWEQVEAGYQLAAAMAREAGSTQADGAPARVSVPATIVSPLLESTKRAPPPGAADASIRIVKTRRRARTHPSVVPALCVAGLVATITLGWMAAVGRSSIADLTTVLSYSGDAIPVLAWIKAYASGDLIPLLPKQFAALGAPYGANWTDFPSEDFLYFAAGGFARLFGLWTGSTLFILFLQILAGLAFFYTGTLLHYRRPVLFAASLLFALAPFAFARSLWHLTLTAYWHIPLALFALKWAAGGVHSGDAFQRHRVVAALGALLAGFLNPYYLAAFLWLAACLLVGAAVERRRRDILATGVIIAIAAGAYVLQSLDSVWMNFAHGPNPEAVVREFTALDVYGLRLPDLAFPYDHRSAWWQAWVDTNYQAHAPGGRGRGEAMFAYIGIVAAVSLFGLLAQGTIRAAAREFARISDWYWMAVGTIGFAIVGGINYFIGAFGFIFLRATNRFSIVIMAIALLWLGEAASRIRRSTAHVALAGAVVALGLWDQIPPRSIPAGVHRTPVEADAGFVAVLEGALPSGAMVLQLPIKKFPETGPLNRMEDYEHLRPYLHAKALRFSYGTIKGRGDSDWQLELAALSPEEVARRAAEYGFAAICMNRKAYQDDGRDLESRLKAVLGAPIASNGDLVAFRLEPAPVPAMPPLRARTQYRGFSARESGGGHAWSWAIAQDASITIGRPYQAVPSSARYDVTFVVESGNGGGISVAPEGMEAFHVEANRPKPVVLRMPNVREWRLRFRSDEPPKSPQNGDPRKIAFRIVDLQVREAAR